MFGDYGYMEEGQLGKPYNLRLLKRLGRYALPYKTTIFKALTLTLLITLLDLTLPYLSKIAIDRYILASWYRVDTSRISTTAEEDLLGKYRHLTVNNLDRTSLFISRLHMADLDPADLHILQKGRILTKERFYRIRDGGGRQRLSPSASSELLALTDGSFLIPYQKLGALSAAELSDLRGEDLQGVKRIGLLFLILLLISFALGYGEYYLLEYTGQHIMQDIRLQLFSRMHSQALRFFDRHPLGRLVTRVTNDIENLNEMFKSVIITVFKDFFILSGILAVLLYLNWRLALVCFILIPFIFVITFCFSYLAREAFRQLRAAVAKINAFMQERISGMRIIQLFCQEAAQMALFRQINKENYLAGMRQIKVFAVFMPVMELFSALAVALLIWHGGGKVISDQLTLGGLVAFISYIQKFFKPIRDIAEKYNIMQSAMASTERVFEFMDLREEIPKYRSADAQKDVRGHIKFREVSFAYKPENPVLKNISFEIKPGEMVAVVGPTGSGKTTLVNLIERFYDPDQGEVLLDGVDLRAWDPKQTHARFGLCMQDVFVFAGTPAENISLGREEIDAPDVTAAAGTANALSFIQKLPNGFAEEIGEGGATLSAGQRQLLSFARALAGNPRVLILDEATSSVDPQTEKLIQDAISRMVLKRTTLVVAHRLSTIRHADRILVMHHGRIREQGTHAELMAIGGIYYRLHKLKEA